MVDEVDFPILSQDPAPGVPAYFGFVNPELLHREPIPLVVCVHGISRDAREQIDLLRFEAQRRGYALLAPLFDKATYGDYQRLGRRGRGPRADLALLELVKRFEETICSQVGPKFLMGFSGGAQFVHRFAMAHPDEIAAAVVTSAGWYSFPDSRVRYPCGLRVNGDLAGVRLEPAEFLRIPFLSVVGSKDTKRDRVFRSSQDLDERQGRNRIERACNWSKSMADEAQRRGLSTRIQSIELPGAGHSFRKCVDSGLDRVGFDFFAAAAAAAAAAAGGALR